MKAEQIAQDTLNWFKNACGDLAYEAVDDYERTRSLWAEPDMRKKLSKARDDGVVDLRGWLADEYFIDSDMLEMVNLHIYDCCRHSGHEVVEVWRAFKEIAPDKLKNKCTEYIERYTKETT